MSYTGSVTVPITSPGRSDLMPVTSAPAITVPAITWYGEDGICRLPELRVSVEPPFRKASFWSCRFCTAVGSDGWAAVEAGPAASGSKPAKADAGPAACAVAGAAVLPGVPERKNTEEPAAASASLRRASSGSWPGGAYVGVTGCCAFTMAGPRSPGSGGPSSGTFRGSLE